MAASQEVIKDSGLSKLLDEIIMECGERTGDTPAVPVTRSTLFEGQLSSSVSLVMLPNVYSFSCKVSYVNSQWCFPF